jgi:hypothetical protein
MMIRSAPRPVSTPPAEVAKRRAAPRRRGDQPAIAATVVGLEKHGLAPIAALGDMVRQVRHNNARDPGHACVSFSRFTRCPYRHGAIS